MGSGVFGLIEYLNRNKDLAYQEALREKEIEAQKNARVAEEAARLQNIRKETDISKVADQAEMMRALSKVIASQHTGGYSGLPELTPDELKNLTATEYAKTVAAQPMATSAAEMSKYNQLQGGSIYDRQIGALAGQAGQAAQQAAIAKNRLGESVDTRRLLTGGNRAAAEDLAATEQAGFTKDITHGMRGFAEPLAQSQMQSGITANQLAAAKNTKDFQAVNKINPELSAQVGEEENKAKIAEAQFMQQLGLPINVLGAQDISIIGQALHGLNLRGLPNPITSALLELTKRKSTNTVASPVPSNLNGPLFQFDPNAK